jgi:hypothetical protein
MKILSTILLTKPGTEQIETRQYALSITNTIDYITQIEQIISEFERQGFKADLISEQDLEDSRSQHGHSEEKN